ncbi:MAG: M60 family metallopeptidase [Bacteroidaceae bacterium]|nr:M60 family metallopeptidase [Bacteroidaceae bacterium]
MKIKTLLFALMAMSVLTATAQLTKGNAEEAYAEFRNYFNDAICTELKTEYAAMEDEELRSAMGDMPTELIDIALKVKNDDAWEEYEKEFRIAEFKPHSNNDEWQAYLHVFKYSNLHSPTGIIGNNEYVYIFIGDDIPKGAELKAHPISDNFPYIMASTKLKKGLNLVSMPEDKDAATLFIDYIVKTDTTSNSKRLADYPNIKLHIEGGHVNGYFDITRHDDEFWRKMLDKHKNDAVAKTYPAIQVLGERVIFHMMRNSIVKACPNTITDAIKWWDECVRRQHELMGVEKYYDRWNDVVMARDGEGGNMTASPEFTYYPNYTLPEILPWQSVYEHPGRMWGPAHEIGHVNQGAINMVGCTEVSNNLFANAQIFRAGISTTRGREVAQCAKDFANKVPFPLREDVFSRTRMYLQLYLYFHAAEKDETFYPRLFEALRQDRLIVGPEMSAVDDQLKFAEKCCEIAQMDLSEFFEAWGFFEPMDNSVVNDYSTSVVTLTAEEAEESRKRMQQYEKKGGHLMFIEDRIKPSPRTDGVSGNRIDYEEAVAIGKMGDTGQWADYLDETVEATGYYFTERNDKIDILKTEDANGALGFKLYDAETGKLLAFSNTYSISIPAFAYNRKYKVMAAQASGCDVEIKNATTADDENIQKETLANLLDDVYDIISETTEDGSEIGRFYTNAVAELNELYIKIDNVIKSGDTSEYSSYIEWYYLLKQEIEKVYNNPDARAILKEGEIYNIANNEHKGYLLSDDDMGLIGKSGMTSLDIKKWIIEDIDDEGTFVIKNINGEYINDIELNVGAMCSGNSIEEAIRFKATYNNDGTLYFTTDDYEPMYLTLKNDYNVVGSNNIVNGSLWTVKRRGFVTSIDEIIAEEGDAAVYDLQGRKVEGATKGIYIMNGNKFLVK